MDLDYGGVDEAEEETVGGFVAVNDDDDDGNGNGTADFADGAANSAMVAGEDDLKTLTVSIRPCDTGTLQLTCTGACGAIRLYDSDGNLVTLPKGWTVPNPQQPQQLPAIFYVEGVSPTAVRGVSLKARFDGDQGPCEDVVKLTVYKVTSVVWETRSGNTALDECPNNKGRRVFPDKLHPEDLLPAARQEVDLVATIDPAVEGRTVYFWVWDVDDPFDQMNPTMPEVSLIDDTPTGGPDNRPSPEGRWSPPAAPTTGADGKARVSFTVSMQPGNNYRAAASGLSDAPPNPPDDQAKADAINNEQPATPGNFDGYKVPLTWSQMLTVWRKLHVETDTMARPTFAQNTVSTQWNQPRFINGQLWIDILDQANGDDFENGYIQISAPGFPNLISVIIDHDWSILDDDIHTNISQATWGSRPNSGACIASDDDLSLATFTAGVLGSDIGIGTPTGYLPLPDTSGLVAHYQPAYILPIHEPSATSTTGIPFIKNMNPETKANWDAARLLRGLPVSTPEYWTAYVFAAFQAEAGEDADQEETNTKGINTHPDGSTRAFWTWGSAYTGMAAIFQEVIRDAYPAYQEQRTVAHEIAHTLGAPHLGAQAVPGDGGLMDETDQGPDFLAQSLKTLREYSGP